MVQLRERLRRSIVEFLAVPVAIVLAFVILAEAVDWLDNHAGPRRAWGPLRMWLSQYVGDTQAAIGVLSAIAGSMFTVTSVTFSILLLAVQQGASVLNSQIVDHYLRRTANRAWFGFFVGVSLFVLVTLVQTTHTSAPVFGVAVSTLLGAIALIALVVLIYSTVDQTRPATVIGDIGKTAIAARERQHPLLAASRPLTVEPTGARVVAPRSGYLVRIDLAAVESALAAHPDARLTIRRSVGDFVPCGATLAIVEPAEHLPMLADAVAAALPLADQRVVTDDPAYSLDHIATIGWTAISTARSDPAVGAIVVHELQKLLHLWAEPGERTTPVQARLFYDDPLPDQLLQAIESLVVAAAESRQHQTLALLLDALADSLPLLPARQQRGVERMMTVVLRSLEEHLPTGMLLVATGRLIASWREIGQQAVADRLAEGLVRLYPPETDTE